MHHLIFTISVAFAALSSDVFASCGSAFTLEEQELDNGKFIPELHQNLLAAVRVDVEPMLQGIGDPNRFKKIEDVLKKLAYLPDEVLFEEKITLGGVSYRYGLLRGFLLAGAMRGHPIAALIFRHEFQHLYTLSGMSRAELLAKTSIFRSMFLLGIERDAFNAEYDFIKSYMSKEDLERFKSVVRIPTREDLLSFRDMMGWSEELVLDQVQQEIVKVESRNKIVTLLAYLDLKPYLRFTQSDPEMSKLLKEVARRKLDILFINLVEPALTKSREAYVESMLESYRQSNRMIFDGWFLSSVGMLTALNAYFWILGS